MSKRATSTMKMHESAALLLCRAAFIALGVAPVAVVVFWSVAELVPAYRNARTSYWESIISARIGVSVEIDSVAQIAPRRFCLENVLLSHPETKLPIARLHKATALQVGKNWFVRCRSGQVSLAEMPQLWNVTHDWVLCRPGQLPGEIVVSFDELLVDGPREQVAFGASQLSLLPTEGEQELQILLGQAKPSPSPLGVQRASDIAVASENVRAQRALISVSRAVVKGQPQTTISINTGAAPLPCSLAHGIAPSLKQLGDKATFQGTAAFLQLQRGWGMWINSQPNEKTVVYRNSPTVLSHVDFGRLTDGTTANVRGEGTITLDRVCMADYGVQEAVGTLEVGSQQNSINLTFLKHACLTLGLEHNFDFAGVTPEMSFLFSKLALQFEFSGDRLRLQGGGEHGDMLVDASSNPRVRRGGAFWEQDIPLGYVVAILERTAAESPGTSGIVSNRDLALLARRWLPDYNRPVTVPDSGRADVAPRTQTASTAVPTTR